MIRFRTPLSNSANNFTTDATMQKITAESPESKSPDLAAEYLAQLKALFPELVTESKDGVVVNVDVLKQLVGEKVITDSAEKYGLNWHGKRRARQIALTPSAGTLRPCPAESVDWDTTKNLMIEGDNLEVLKLLQKSYAGKVKLIYIDPPYNTGKDFVYPDNFQDNIKNYLELTGQAGGEGKRLSSNTEASGRFHTDWLNMIYPRLKLARNLLRDDGVIFISIDDHEVDDLRKVCAEVFGEENFLACVIWERADSPRMDADYFSTKHDYVVGFAKNLESFSIIRKPYEGADIPDHFSKSDETGRKYYTKPLRAMGGQGETRAARPNLYYAITAPDGTQVYPKLEGGGDGAWRWSSKKLKEEMHRIEWVKTESSWTPYYRIFADESAGKPPETIWFSEDVGSTRTATAEVKSLFDDIKCFDTPKPIDLIEQLISISAGKYALILDFFGGSGTTGHAVISANSKDEGARRYVIVQLPEPLDPAERGQSIAANFCDQIKKPRNIAELTKERLRRAAKRTKEESSLFAGDAGFRVFKLDSTNIREWDPKRDNLAASLEESVEHLKKDRSPEDILYELLLKLGLDLCVPIETKKVGKHEVHNIGAGSLLVCLSSSIPQAEVEPLALGIAGWHKELNPAGESTVVFKDSAFADDVAKTNLAAILQQHGIETVRSL